MTCLWLIIWALNGYPDLHPWNSWLVALAVMLTLDAGASIERTVKANAKGKHR